MTLTGSLKELLAHPLRFLLARWNWKAAMLSVLFRGTIFFAVNLRSGWEAATAAFFTELVYRTLTSGFYASITQSLRRVEPGWKAALFALGVLPLFQHGLEFLVHSLRGTAHLALSVFVSACFTGVSSLFNLYVMRRGAMLVESGAPSLTADMKRMPALVAGFVAFIPVRLYRLLHPSSGALADL